MLLSQEVELILRENPHLMEKSIKEIATFFMVQGEVRFSILRDTLNHKCTYLYNRFHDTDPELAEKILADWESVSSMYKPSKKDKMESMSNE